MAGVNPVPEHLSLLLSSYLDGELRDGELDEVVALLDTDLDAIAEFRRLQAIRRELRTLPSLDPPTYVYPSGHLDEELSAYLDGELASDELPGVITHLGSCPDCRAELADLDRARTAVRALPGVEPPSFLEVARVVEADRRRRVWPAAAIVGGIAATALAFALAMTPGSEPASVDLADLESRHTAVASVPASVSGVEVSAP